MAASFLDSVIGIDLTALVTGTTTDGVNAIHPLGTRVKGTSGTIWQYVQAAAAITQYNCVCITEDGQAVASTKALVDAGHQVGFAQVAFADNEIGWVAVNGTDISCTVAAACAADVQLYTTGTAGVLDDTAASQTAIRGVVCVATTSAAAAIEIIASFPSGTATA